MTALSNLPHPDDLRRREVVEAAAGLLAEDGPAGLTLRRVAASAGGSTQLVYTLFGGKAGLADALYAEGFVRLADLTTRSLSNAPPPGDPDRVVACGRAYCDFARGDSALFSLMFGRAIPGFTPRRETRRAGRDATMGQLVRTVAECQAEGTLVSDDAERVAHVCWATAHGVASLLVAGLLPDDDHALTTMLRTPVLAHLPGGATWPS
ncbi:TetR/AcrR family transcriptional regulator [Nocardioides sp. AX2bis]|uniref:TetR/AcrR family transcriptional regulator n=1 Tax=Nocardioides sp. AX2bis TaxID=2653157 RepID=UPI0012F1B596|nr:WHG domain-containing protein [Nocardioides sp. AX2bis]VXC25675.1 Transcriptional regulator, TetR family [Nocardioides sp. AX2bis]